MSARIVIISGASGTGKTSISKILAEKSLYDRAVHIHSDDFYQYIRKGYISPWLNGTGNQNGTVIESVAASAKSFSEGGYEVFVDGVIGPWFLGPWIKLAQAGIDVRYIILRPSKQETIKRATYREQKESFPLIYEVVSTIWVSFNDLEKNESHVIDTTAQTADESAALIHQMLLEDDFRIL